MTRKAKKPEGKVTKAGAVELEESALDEVSGGAFDTFLKLKDIPGETLEVNTTTTGDLSQIAGDGSYKISPTGKTFTR